ncbi:MFS transporter [Thermodesulfobacteriota bacterium]
MIFKQMFYGWWIVGALFLIAAYFTGIVIFGFTAFFEPIAQEFGWSYTQISLAASLRGLETGLLAPVAGLLIDRYGPRKLVFVGAMVTGFGLFLLSRINSLGMLYIAIMAVTVGSSTCTGVVPMTTVANWFKRKVSLATAIITCGPAAGGLMVPLVARTIDWVGWRTAMRVFCIGTWAIILPLALLLRKNPEKYGYLPDGSTDAQPVSEESKDINREAHPDISIEVGFALRSRLFWQIVLAFMCHALVIITVITHIMPYLSSVGISRTISSLAVSGITLISVPGRLGSGWLGDRYNKRWVTAFGFVLVLIGMLCFSYVTASQTWLLIPFLILFGIGYGGPVPMLPALAREYYGRAHLGTLLGITQGVYSLCNIVGPPMAGLTYDHFGTYRLAWFALAAAMLISMASMLSTPSVETFQRKAALIKD